ncbi:hypothetical protein GGR51DRAFT_408051 [Nemania sp. FL0031]|nr:hypothetical protein GGR51DRAFT_408051 [Nemania sp. FL0031]
MQREVPSLLTYIAYLLTFLLPLLSRGTTVTTTLPDSNRVPKRRTRPNPTFPVSEYRVSQNKMTASCMCPFFYTILIRNSIWTYICMQS